MAAGRQPGGQPARTRRRQVAVFCSGSSAGPGYNRTGRASHLRRLPRADPGQDIAGQGAFSLGMFAEFEPAIRKYGAHLYRRLFWETGAIGQVLYLEAEVAGLRGTGIGCFFDDPVHEAFGLSGLELQSLYHFTIGGPVEDARLSTLPAYPPRISR